MIKNNFLLVSDFASDFISNTIKSNKKNKKFNFKSKNYDNILINSDQLFNLNKNCEYLFLITQIDKIYNLNEICLLKESAKINKIKNITTELSNIIIKLSQKYKKIFFFLWPQDTKDNYFGYLNFKKFGKNWLVNFINLELSSHLSHIDNIYVVDPNFKLLKYEKSIEIYDNKTKYLIGNNYSLDFMEFIANEINIIIELQKINKIKLLIIDLDNTIWGGEAGERNCNLLELGPNSIKGQVYQDFQKRLKILKQMGYILATCSKNDIKNVKKVFKSNKNMILKMSDFSAHRINWNNKNENVAEILKELNIRSENALFIDDTSQERNIVNSYVKNIQIFDFPDNILLLNERFNQLEQLEKNIVSETDKKRTKLYLEEKKRINTKEKFFDKSEWLSSLEINIKINKLKNLNRAEEMFLRTNQFNTSHVPLSSQKLKILIKDKDRFFYEVEMSDKYGNYGIIAVVGIKIEKNKFIITDFLESCRVFQRNVEEFIFKRILKDKLFKKKEGLVLLNRNKKNIYVQNLFDKAKYLKKIDSNFFLIIKNYPFDEIKKIKIKIN